MESKTVIFVLFSFVCVLKAEGPNFKQKDTFVQQEFDNVYQDLRGKAPGFKDYAYLSSTQTFSGLQTFLASGTTAWIMTSSGKITEPLQTCFLAGSGGATDVTGDGTTYTIPWSTEIYDKGNDLSGTTFTAPVDGKYLLVAHLTANQILSTHTGQDFRIVTSNRNYLAVDNYTNLASSFTNHTLIVSVIAEMEAADTATVTINVNGGTKTVDDQGGTSFTYFSGALLN